jgi:branched-subunit amino acid aminotransferase/4-amino-4-deoxychorismate lyase
MSETANLSSQSEPSEPLAEIVRLKAAGRIFRLRACCARLLASLRAYAANYPEETRELAQSPLRLVAGTASKPSAGR